MKFPFKPRYYPMSMRSLNRCNEISNNYKNERKTSLGKISRIHLAGKYILSRIQIIARAIATIALIVFETLAKPYFKTQRKFTIATQIANDIKHQDLDLVKKEITDFIEDPDHGQGLKSKTQKQKDKYAERALSVYASTREHYAPVVIDWVSSLLETAMASNPPKRLVFMARDGIAPYEVAKILKEKYPDKFGEVGLSLIFASRNVLDWVDSQTESTENRQMFIDYVKQEGVKQDEPCIFVDIGFYGSMIDPIKNILAGLTTKIEFSFLVSHTHNAQGFMGDMRTPLESITAAGQNPAVHWLEDTHQGVINSAVSLFRQNSKILPQVSNSSLQSTCRAAEPKSYLYKHFGLKAIIDAARSSTFKTPYISDRTKEPKEWNMASRHCREQFDQFLMQYWDRKRFSFSKHF